MFRLARARKKSDPLPISGPAATWTIKPRAGNRARPLSYSPQSKYQRSVQCRCARFGLDYGCSAIENSTEGAVSHTLDVFMCIPSSTILVRRLLAENRKTT